MKKEKESLIPIIVKSIALWCTDHNKQLVLKDAIMRNQIIVQYI